MPRSPRLWPAKPENLVLFTDSHTGEMRPRDMDLTIPLEPGYATLPPKPAVRQPQLKGLCITCLYAESCVYAKRAQAGVWHCEMYE
jgi:hypothetical protein